MSEGEEFEDDMYGNDNESESNTGQLKTAIEGAIEEEDSTQPVKIIKEEITTIVKNPNSETTLVEEDEEEADEDEVVTNNNREEDDDNLYEQLKTHSIQLSRLSDTVESLQSQIKQLQETILSDGGKTTISPRRKSIKTKKKTTGRKRTTGSKKK